MADSTLIDEGNVNLDVSSENGDILSTEKRTETCSTNLVPNTVIHDPDKMHNAADEIEFKSPNQFAVPLSISTQKQKKDVSMPTKANVTTESTVQAEYNKLSDSYKQHTSVPYTEPEWGGMAEDGYSFDVLKNGSIVGSVCLNTKPFHVFGRLPSCDVTLEHPSLSRYHAVVQYSATSTSSHEKGWYIFDLDSTHGTWVNKKKIQPKVYHRLKVGHIIKFGGSSRLHILQGPLEDEEEESEMTITEMKEQKEKLRKETDLLRQMELQEEIQRQEEEKKMLEDRGCGWGMDEDAEDVEGDNPYASLLPENESLYIDDPKKALKGFYEREGYDLPDYQFTEVAMGKHKCRLDLPVDGPNGEELIAEVVVSGKRKDAVIACALEACRMLDKLGMLRSSTHESRKRKQKKWEDDDFYDSDEDTFLDRTGTIEKKRVLRMKKAGKDAPETYESLLEKYNHVIQQIEEIEMKLQKAKAEAEAHASEEMDELDAYMVSIKHGAMDTKTRMQLKGDLMRLKAEEQKLRKLVNIAKPPSLPPLKPLVAAPPVSAPVPTADSLASKLHAHQKQHKKVLPVRTQIAVPVEMKPGNYEEEDEEEEEEEQISNESHQTGTSTKVEHNTQIMSPTTDFAKTRGPALPPQPTEGTVKLKGPSLPPPKTSISTEKVKTSKSHLKSTAAILNELETKKVGSKKGIPVTDPNFESSDPDYAMWLPPEEQSGDGRTSLNDKLGY